MVKIAVVSCLLAVAGNVPTEITWHLDIRTALEEAEGRGVPLLVYLSRDD